MEGQRLVSSEKLGAPIRAEQLGKTYVTFDKGKPRAVEVLRGLDLQIEAGEFFSILGPSGSGKTTFLRILAGLVSAEAGQVTVAGKPVKGPRPDLAVVFQQFNLLPWKSVLQNAEYGLQLRKIGSKAERRDTARHFLNMVGLSGFEDAYPHQLSGGMQQRVGIARALAMRPAVLLMDEPFASVDAQTRETLQEELLRIHSQFDSTVVFITHSIDEAVFLSDRFAVFSPRPSRVLDCLDVDLPAERWATDVRASASFAELRHAAWQLLHHDPAAKAEDPGHVQEPDPIRTGQLKPTATPQPSLEK